MKIIKIEGTELTAEEVKLFDTFAGRAMQGLITGYTNRAADYEFAELADHAYSMARSMIKERRGRCGE